MQDAITQSTGLLDHTRNDPGAFPEDRKENLNAHFGRMGRARVRILTRYPRHTYQLVLCYNFSFLRHKYTNNWFCDWKAICPDIFAPAREGNNLHAQTQGPRQTKSYLYKNRRMKNTDEKQLILGDN